MRSVWTIKSNVYSYSSARQTITLPDLRSATLTFHLYPASGEAVMAAPSALLLRIAGWNRNRQPRGMPNTCCCSTGHGRRVCIGG
jgi:hypothetical protein